MGFPICGSRRRVRVRPAPLRSLAGLTLAAEIRAIKGYLPVLRLVYYIEIIYGCSRWLPRARACPSSSGLRRRVEAAAAVGHELVEFRLVLRVTQALEKFEKLALLVFEPAQRLVAIFVERAVSAGGRGRRARAPPAIRRLLHPVHPALHAAHVTLPALPAIDSATHPTTPYHIAEHQDAQRPEHYETRDDQRDPGRLAEIVQPRGERCHGGPHVNVYHIHISAGHAAVKMPGKSSAALPGGEHAEAAQINQDAGLQQFFRGHRQCPAAAVAAAE